ncbi:hypothetical protein BJV78DRAFT_1153918 [Lactifluus subvellereus]|nr:hypothetical protein BJV78DRAFT_1153918 [Lactifluus subvellereus]
MRLETLMLAKTKHESELQRWTSGSQRRVLCHVSPFVLCLRLHSRQADRALIVVRHTSAARVYKFPTDPGVRCRTPTKAELVVQLREETQQWKVQCLRLEETFRGEINAWKDQFLRIDAEHTHLLNQLSSQATLAHTPKRVPIRTVDPPRSHRCEHRPHSPTKALPPPRVVHRVQAAIEVPVREEVEGECCELDTKRPPDAGVLHHTSTPTGGGDVRRRKSSAGSHHRTEVARSDSVDEGEEGPSDEASGGGYVDDEVENAGMGTLTVRGKTMPRGQKHIFQQPDEEDDELMMYASLKDKPQKTHPHVETHLPRLPCRKSVINITAQRLSATNVSTQKRRTTETGPGSAALTKRRR